MKFLFFDCRPICRIARYTALLSLSLVISPQSARAADEAALQKFVEHLPPASANALATIDHLKSLKSSAGVGPSDKQLVALLTKADSEWSISDLRHIWVDFVRLQESPISANDLVDIYRSTRDG